MANGFKRELTHSWRLNHPLAISLCTPRQYTSTSKWQVLGEESTAEKGPCLHVLLVSFPEISAWPLWGSICSTRPELFKYLPLLSPVKEDTQGGLQLNKSKTVPTLGLSVQKDTETKMAEEMSKFRHCFLVATSKELLEWKQFKENPAHLPFRPLLLPGDSWRGGRETGRQTDRERGNQCGWHRWLFHKHISPA